MREETFGHARLWLGGVALALLAGSAAGAEVRGEVAAQRGAQTLRAEGDAPAGAGEVRVALALGAEVALEATVPVKDGRWTLVRRLAPRLAPAAYRLAVAAQDAPWAEGELRVGTAADEARARAQQREYFRGVYAELARAHGSLEDRAGLRLEAGELERPLSEDLRSLGQAYLSVARATTTGLRVFDLRAAAPYEPALRAQAGELVTLLRARAEAWAAHEGDAPPAQDPRVQALATELAQALELPPEAAERFARSAWGRLEPPLPEAGGRWTSVLGVSLELPGQTQPYVGVERLGSPEIRLFTALGGERAEQFVMLRVVRLPFEVVDFESFVRYVEVENWEQEGLFTGYRRLAAAPDPEHQALRMRFSGHLRDLRTAEGGAVEGQQLALYDPEGRRAAIVYLFGDGADPGLLETLRWEAP
ncbi:MAG: hypothetical protein R3F62_19760 [Planctomycetota bacterium]